MGCVFMGCVYMGCVYTLRRTSRHHSFKVKVDGDPLVNYTT